MEPARTTTPPPVFEPVESNENILQRNVNFFTNCMVLANYDSSNTKSYASAQIKADLSRNLLVATCTKDVTNFGLTKLDKTVDILRQICSRAFEDAEIIGNYTAAHSKKSPWHIRKFERSTLTAIFVFEGLIRMYDVYAIQYDYNLENKGFKKLHDLSLEVQKWSEKIIMLVPQVFGHGTILAYNKKRRSIEWHGKNPHTGYDNITPYRIDEVNVYCLEEQQYYQSMNTLCEYDPHETSDYSKHQIKVSENTKLFVLTSTLWSFRNWAGSLTTLKKTASVMNEYCERMKTDCFGYYSLLQSPSQLNPRYRDRVQEEIEYLIDYALFGLKRMVKTYTTQYANDRSHPGLNELIACASESNLSWTMGIKFK